MEIMHYPLFDTKAAEEIYSEKDGVPVTYVCTTGTKESTVAADVFYRDTPHPKFGNRYFCLYHSGLEKFPGGIAIAGADWIEALTFDMIKSEGCWYYSSHRHDMVNTAVGFIDGGRSYTRLGGSVMPKAKSFVVRNGKFVEKSSEDR